MKKRCSSCSEEKWLSEFANDKKSGDGRHSHCKVCRRTAARESYNSKPKHSRSPYDKARAAKSLAIVNEARKNGCELCPEKELVCLDFHHRDATQKDFSISNARSYSEERLINELKKCAVLCSNCHRKLHAGLISLLGV